MIPRQGVPVVELSGVGRTFPGSPPVVALHDADLSIATGDYVSIVGPSGSGKSTLLNILGCLDRPTSGNYWLDGFDVGALPDGLRAGLRATRIGFVFQSFHLLPHRTAAENVMTSMLYQRISRSQRRTRTYTALERVGLSHRAAFPPTKLSGGERQRVAIARAVASRPSILLCDEPTGNLDSATTESILDLFEELRSDGLTLILVTHDAAVSSRAARRIEMVDGLLAEDAA